ncbi:hypothetical protein AN7095.2 [Aspergillus nidulans FGSC A4]|uniref:Endonuclease/exonuclease/phosphatase domain-containing protein n=1 Tax=Emericella nidulans (strain FGSC A4 / ATCC 38163 / CBS 112.46 / NRRL 194 / M139) TaxID=227321 RepID=Q5AX85_EMENI|nr:hypothetical protein [Aspergillus nidulans FGSC A4]EAA61300.1 hypothetical protein AN7095.2 [Aspergillus nidulans FGSC A4]CBF79095.1 TPA: conserved hypothetical protein [Aspergillus nidulans FGSC A4]|eukprot:XP_664699.1 hypothetical protein AN7095.2 [Aspergillus nidulans FGSC A4]
MEVDISPPGGTRPATPLLGENSDPPSGPTTPTPLPRNSLKRRALFSPQKTPTAAPVPVSHTPQAPSICEQVGMVADDQLALLHDWKLAMTSLAKALDLTVSSLQGRPRDLARELAARFVTLAKQDSPQQISQMPVVAPPQPPRQMEQPNHPPTPEASKSPLNRQTSQPTTWASLTAPRTGQGNWQTIAPEHHMQAKQTAQRRLKQSNKTDHRIFLRLPASSSLRAIGPHGIRVTLAGKVPVGITQVQVISTGYAITTTEQGKAFLLSEKAASLAGDGYFEIPTEYHQVIVSRIPKQLWSLDGWIDTTIADISMEAERITGIKPLMAKLSKHPVERDSITAVIAFPKKLQHPLQLFGLSGLSRPTRPKQRPLQCTRCYRFHDTRACRSSDRCISCGSSKQDHNCHVQCINCCGPHAADFPKCPARPHVQRNIITRLSKDALAAIRKAGRLAFQQEQKKAESSKQQADRRGGAAHDLLLSFEADIILVQEPWTNTAKHLTKTHPRYQLFSPPTRWTARPRTLTYVRRDLPAHSLPEPISPDITTIYTAGLTIINVYRPPNDPVAPAGAGSTPSTLSTLLGYTPPENTILAGDFNTRHPFWQPDTESHAVTPGATGLLDWLDAHELELRLEPGTPTRGPNIPRPSLL